MKVVMKRPKGWIGCYHIAQTILFWKNKDCDTVDNLAEWLYSFNKIDHTTWIPKLLDWIHLKRNKSPKIVIHEWDVWSLDVTLSQITHPLLIKLKNTAIGYPNNIDETDLPEDLHGKEGCVQWKWILDQMIWSHYQIGYMDFSYEKSLEDIKKYNERVQKGLYLFAKYYRNLWD